MAPVWIEEETSLPEEEETLLLEEEEMPLEEFATEPVRINKIDGCWLSSYKEKDKVKQRQCLC